MRYHTERSDFAIGNSTVRNRVCATLFAGFLACIAATVWGGMSWEGRKLDGARAGVATSAGLRQADIKAARVALFTPYEPNSIRLCQALGPAAPCNICAVDCSQCYCGCCPGWESARMIDWQAYAQGEYVGHARLAHVPEYRLRVDDQIDMTYRLTREETPDPYKLNVGDEIRIESFTDAELNRDLLIQPDGTITLRLLGQVHATGRTVTQLRDALDELYKKYYKVPSITVTPLKVNSKLEDLRKAKQSASRPRARYRCPPSGRSGHKA
ncbi:MAG: polysaccharide biosynthesis/export family protein [Thermoguttaceae bacterium]